MNHKKLQQTLKSLVSFLIILLLLPYVITVFLHGADRTETDNVYVRVREITADNEEQITELPWKEYFIGVLAHEVPDSAEEEFLKAQAVLIRTNLYGQMENSEDKVLDEAYLTPEEMERRALEFDYETYYGKLERACEETGNQVLLYQDTYAYVPFHKVSSGLTRSYQEVTGLTDYPYLVVRECPLDKEAQDETQTSIFDYRDVQKKCQSFLVAVEESEAGKTYQFSDFEIISYDSAGYVLQMRIGDTYISGDQFRDALSLPSSAFSLEDSDGRLCVRTEGTGHGFGLSQWTANEMAKEGKTYEEILQFFFEGTVLTDQGEMLSGS